MKIILIGFMGAGKSSVGKRLAKKMEVPFFEMDQMIIEKAGKSIQEIFEQEGEIFFRELEQQVSMEISEKSSGVVSTGGGVVMNNVSMGYLKKGTKLIYLKAGFDTIVNRIGGSKERPLFKDQAKAQELYQLREPLYKYYADQTIESNRKRIEEVVDEITNLLNIA
jgi:shikimate kinase